MLHLLRTPQWQPPGQAARLLPATVPGCLLVYLASRADWLDREHLTDFFWPDEPAAQAQRKLRVTQHRLQGLLDNWVTRPPAPSCRPSHWPAWWTTPSLPATCRKPATTEPRCARCCRTCGRRSAPPRWRC